MIEIEQLFALLKENGVAAKATLVFEANHLENANPPFGASLAAGLQALVSRDGLLVVPTCTPAEGFPKPAFDLLLSPSELGWFSELFRGLPGVYRSNNPTHSTAAWGAAAEGLVAGHRFVTGRQTPWGESAFGHDCPWDRLNVRNAWWVMVNPDWYSSPFTAFLFSRYWELQQGVTKTTPFPDFDPLSFSQEIEKIGFATRATWGSYPVFIFKLRDAMDLLLSELARHPARFGPTEAFQDWLAQRDQVKENGYLLAGASRIKITPPTPAVRWDGKQLDGVFHDLYARALVFADGPRRCAVVVCDLVGLTRDLVLKIREKVNRQAGLPVEAILIACTHAHSTPDTIAAGFSDPAYLDFLVEAVTEAICRAAGNLQPVRMGWKQVTIRGLAHSRRQKLLGGKVYTTRYSVPSTWRVRPGLVAGSGPIDPDLTVGRIERLNGEVLAVIANFGCHASVALASPNISGDYPGEAMAALESVLGESSVVLCTNGAAADVDPTFEMPYWGPRNDANAVRLGRIYAAQVLEALERAVVQDRVAMELVAGVIGYPAARGLDAVGSQR